jgi:hypothetical protein
LPGAVGGLAVQGQEISGNSSKDPPARNSPRALWEAHQSSLLIH